MSKKRGSLLSYRPDIKVVDATLRDGGLVNDFRFTEDFVRDLYAANVAAGIDYMEFGYKASKDIFDPKDFGPWKFCEEADLRNIVGDNDTDMKIAELRCQRRHRNQLTCSRQEQHGWFLSEQTHREGGYRSYQEICYREWGILGEMLKWGWTNGESVV